MLGLNMLITLLPLRVFGFQHILPVCPSWQHISRHLSSTLSPQSLIFLPNDRQYKDLTARWQRAGRPELALVVAVANEHDVAETLRYARTLQIEVFAFTGGHGNSETLESIKNAIGISMQMLSYVRISSDGRSAEIGGGTKTIEVIQALSQAGKRTATATCECTGFISTMLGGGHGFLQDQYGLVTDQLLSARLVLANGSFITVSSEQNPDLFWAVKGAGHNFGVVTSAIIGIHDMPARSDKSVWNFEQHVFKEDMLEQVLKLANVLVKRQPYTLMHFCNIMLMPDIDAEKPVFVLTTLFEGSRHHFKLLTRPIDSLRSVTSSYKSVSYAQLPAVFGVAMVNASCIKRDTAGTVLTYPTYLNEYNASSIRIAYDLFTQSMQAHPAIRTSTIAINALGTRAMLGHPQNSSAIAFRKRELYASPMISFDTAYDNMSQLDAYANDLGQTLRRILNAGDSSTEFLAYVNDARGNEGPRAWYGADDWRQEKLIALKNEYDPENIFFGQGPIRQKGDNDQGG